MSAVTGEPREQTRLALGQKVRVLAEPPPISAGKPHIRTPYYIRGKSGVVAASVGSFRNPETLALGGDGLPAQPLYRIRFAQTEVWPDYAGRPGDTIDIEIYQHWLAPAG